jgi:fructose-bisphosphate aldolase class I
VNPGEELESTARALLAPGKGILAADESFPTIGKRFKELGIESTEESRRAYREMLFTAPGLGESISGVILFDETIRQKASGGSPLPAILEAQGIIPGIKVDEGTQDLPGFPGEKFTAGLDGLRERLADYRKLGARFAKWRAVIGIGAGIPTDGCIEANATIHALYAALCQEAGVVPIVEPEILMEGDHTIERCEEVATATLRAVFEKLTLHRVALGGMLLKTGMVLPGEDAPGKADPGEIARATLRCFRAAVPEGVPGIVFLSGGQGDVEATQRLNALCSEGGLPWKLTFSYGRALQDAPMRAWGGKPGNVPAAQAALARRARANGLAVQGRYIGETEKNGRVL